MSKTGINTLAEQMDIEKFDDLQAKLLGANDPDPTELPTAYIDPKKKKAAAEDTAPIGEKPALPTAFVARLAADGVTVEQYETWLKNRTKSKGIGKRNSYLTDNDKDILHFLALSKYSTEQIVAISRSKEGVKDYTARKQLKRLIDRGMVRRINQLGCKTLYTLTQLGMETAGYELPLVSGTAVNPTNIQPVLGVSWALAESWKIGRRDFLSEQMIKSAMGKKNTRKEGTYRAMGKEADRLWDEWDKTDPDNSPEKTNLFLYGMPNSDADAEIAQFHLPDLIVTRPRVLADEKGAAICDENGKYKVATAGDLSAPTTIAIEVERAYKTKDKIAKILRLYMRHRKLYGLVIWYVATDAIGDRIKEAMAWVGMPETMCKVKNIEVVNEQGELVRYRGGNFAIM